jgi:sulfite exporter TauE/SafE
MLASINPLGERARRTRWGRTVVWYTLGSTAGGAAVGAACGLAGRLIGWSVSPSLAAVGVIVVASCAVGLVLDLGVGGARVPSRRRQVNEDWLGHYRGWVYGTGFGFQLGTGLATTVTTSAVYVWLVLAVLSGSVGRGLVIGATFGLGRALPILAVAGAHDPERLRGVLSRAHALAGPSRLAVVGCLFMVGAASVAALAG